jgi:radical SAM protein (TIGR01212 family)
LRYFSLKTYLDRRFGVRVAKISLDAGLTCPNRDGTLSGRGCLYCDAHGSGTGAAEIGRTIRQQMAAGLAVAGRRADRFIAYFQSYTNTYAPLEHLKSLWDQALEPETVVGLSIGTRPDCLPDDVLDLLAGYADRHEVWLELGLQSSSDDTLARINRGHSAADFARASGRAQKRGLKVVAHVILGLPGEGLKEMIATARFVSDQEVAGIKLHSLYVPRGSDLAEVYARGGFRCLAREDYVKAAVHVLESLDPGIVVHRLTGDAAPKALIAPEWCLDKQRTLRDIRARLQELDTWQGRALGGDRPEF